MKYGEWEILYFDKLGSTNDKAQEFCLQKGKKTIVQAGTQTSGRGRRDHQWVSCAGNLFFSLVLEFDLKYLGHLVIISALSVWETIKELSPTADVLLKWPNDILLHNAKVCGILLEKGAGDYIIVGIGVNIAEAPKNINILYPVTSLKKEGINTTADAFLQLFLQKLSSNLEKRQQKGFAPLQQKWLDNVKNIGQEIVLKQEKRTDRGIFLGIDEDGNLLLKTENATEKFLAGEVFYVEK